MLQFRNTLFLEQVIEEIMSNFTMLVAIAFAKIIPCYLACVETETLFYFSHVPAELPDGPKPEYAEFTEEKRVQKATGGRLQMKGSIVPEKGERQGGRKRE